MIKSKKRKIVLALTGVLLLGGTASAATSYACGSHYKSNAATTYQTSTAKCSSQNGCSNQGNCDRNGVCIYGGTCRHSGSGVFHHAEGHR